MKRIRVFHPVLFAIYPVLFLYSINIREVFLKEIFAPLLVSLSIMVVIWGLFLLFFKNADKSGILATTFLLFFFFYGHIYNLVKTLFIPEFFFPIWCVLFLTTLIFLMFKLKKREYKATKVLNFISSILIVIVLFNIILFALKDKSLNISVSHQQPTRTLSHESTNFPDIYYLIPDGYTSFHGLKKYFNFDNAEFLKFLKDKGFFVAQKSTCNFMQTYTSLASVLNLKYINHLKNEMGANSQNVRFLYEMVRNNYLFQLLKQKGYRTIHLGCGKGESMNNPYADLDFRFADMSEFMMFLLQTSMLRPFENRFIDDIKRVRMQFDKAKQLISMTDKPKIMFIHFLLPHPPLAVDRNGNRLPKYDHRILGSDWLPRDRYVEQTLYTNKLMTEFIDQVLKKSKRKPVIVLLGDHGPYINTEGKNKFIDQRIGILNAVYMPDFSGTKFYDTITALNTMREVISKIFGLNLERLKDKVFFSDYGNPYNFEDITEYVAKSLSWQN